MLSFLTNGLSAPVRSALGRALDGRELSVEEGLVLSDVRGRELMALCVVADELRRRQVGDDVSYVINRNINFTNVCIKACHFCAFSRKLRSEQAYMLDTEAVVARALRAVEYGATEVCLQAGLAPDLGPDFYIELIAAVHQAAPDLHLHALSPEEIKHGARAAGCSYRDYLAALRDAGLGSLPGTSAEILDDELRARISPGRITTGEWLDIITAAHELGIPTTSTMMFGHVEDAAHRIRHMALLRDVQRDTGGFTEFVPLSFVHAEAPLFVRGKVAGVEPGPTGDDVIRLYAIARLMLGSTLRNIQASWVKEGLRMSQWLLDCGVNDLGGTLMNESISTTAGAANGQLVSPAMLRHVIRKAGRTPLQRTTDYRPLRHFDAADKADGDGPADALDTVEDARAVFGSYDDLAESAAHRYEYAR